MTQWKVGSGTSGQSKDLIRRAQLLIYRIQVDAVRVIHCESCSFKRFQRKLGKLCSKRMCAISICLQEAQHDIFWTLSLVCMRLT